MKLKKVFQIGRTVFLCAIFLFAVYAFVGANPDTALFFKTQVGPTLFTACATSATWAICLFFGWLIFTFVFGRWFCGTWCPLGIFQELLGNFRFLNRKTTHSPYYHYVRYLILGGAIGFLLMGYVWIFKLDPFTIFGNTVAAPLQEPYTYLHNWMFPIDLLHPTLSVGYGALAILAILIIVSVLYPRWYCAKICPVGTLLGLCAKKGFFRLGIESHCGKCKLCVKACPMGCIDPDTLKIDNENCIRCMKCVATCNRSAITWQTPFHPKTEAEAEVNTARREFICGGLVVGAAVTTGTLAHLNTAQKVKLDDAPKTEILPPGAGSVQRFNARCTGCQLCVTHCIGNAIRPPNAEHSLIHLECDKGVCEFNCKACTEVCPTGAIIPMTLAQKQRLRIGVAEFFPALCVTIIDGTDCGACAEHCPTGALRMKADARGIRIPEINPDLCIGCGNCEHPCPVRPAAVRVMPIDVQVVALDPASVNTGESKEEVPADRASDEWLI